MDYNEVDKYKGKQILHEDINNHIQVFTWQWNHLWLSLAAAKFHFSKDHLVDSFRQWGAI
eukprot:3030526-Ditylum_brightwellii.AAC.1